MSKYKPEQLDQIFDEFKKFIDNPEYKLRVINLRKYIDEKYPREADNIKQNVDEIRNNFVGLYKRVGRIEKCLGIDFELDKLGKDDPKQIEIDYSFIQDDMLREKANAYYREMLRYQYATRNHKQCFGEFCRLAIIQVEIMLNYFFVDDIKLELLAKDDYETACKEWEKNGEKGEKPIEEKYVERLRNNTKEEVFKKNYVQKCRVFCNEYFNLNNKYIRNNQIKSISIWTSDMRNRKSHGSWTAITPYEGIYEEDYLTEDDKRNLEEFGLQIKEKVKQHNEKNKIKIEIRNHRLITTSEGWNKMPKELKNLYNEQFMPLQWVSEKPFKDVHEFLRIIASICAKELKKNE